MPYSAASLWAKEVHRSCEEKLKTFTEGLPKELGRLARMGAFVQEAALLEGLLPELSKLASAEESPDLLERVRGEMTRLTSAAVGAAAEGKVDFQARQVANLAKVLAGYIARYEDPAPMEEVAT